MHFFQDWNHHLNVIQKMDLKSKSCKMNASKIHQVNVDSFMNQDLNLLQQKLVQNKDEY